MEELYRTLGVNSSASDKEIAKAYRDLVKKNHPDVGGNAEVFKKIQNAYEILSDPSKKNAYASKNSSYNKTSVNNTNDFFNDLFKQHSKYKTYNSYEDYMNDDFTFTTNSGEFYDMASSANWTRNRNAAYHQMENLDIHIIHQIHLKDLYANHSGNITWSWNSPCDTCHGTGKHKHSNECPTCSGTGKIVFNGKEHACALCKGTGKIGEEIEHDCPTCSGSGYVSRTSTESFFIGHLKNNIINDQVITVSLDDRGHRSKKSNRRGKLIVEIHYIKSPFFSVKNNFDIVYKDSINWIELLKNPVYKFEYIDGSIIELPSKILLENTTEPIIFNNKGLIDKMGISRGNLIVDIKISIDISKIINDKELMNRIVSLYQ